MLSVKFCSRLVIYDSDVSKSHGRVQRGVGTGGPDPPGKTQVTEVVIGLLRNTGTDPPPEAIGPLGSNCFLREVCNLPVNTGPP